jgi:glycosyltransferase involved in cell wall biosynthesis
MPSGRAASGEQNTLTVIAMIPAHNEEASIGEVIRRIPRSFGGCRVKILVVDDGSTDRSAAVAKENRADYVLSLGARRGLAKAFAAGLNKALEQGASIVVSIDADGQYDPEQIPQLVEPIVTGNADLVLGSRFAGWIEEMPIGKRIGNRIATKLTSHLAGTRISDAQTGFRALSREAVMKLNILGDYTYVQESLIQAVRKNLRIWEVPVNFRKRVHDDSRLISSLFSYARRAGLTMLRTYRDYRPFETFLAIGVILFVAGIAAGFRVFVHFFLTGQVSPFIPSAILSAVLLILGFQAIFLALVADMLGRTRTLVEEVLYAVRSQQRKDRPEA